jgi:hypothetical protein
MAIWRTFLKFEVRQTAIIVSSGLPHSAKQVQILKKCAPNCHYYQPHLTGWAALPYYGVFLKSGETL